MLSSLLSVEFKQSLDALQRSVKFCLAQKSLRISYVRRPPSDHISQVPHQRCAATHIRHYCCLLLYLAIVTGVLLNATSIELVNESMSNNSFVQWTKSKQAGPKIKTIEVLFLLLLTILFIEKKELKKIRKKRRILIGRINQTMVAFKHS